MNVSDVIGLTRSEAAGIKLQPPAYSAVTERA
jgi:hypothetical protein